MAPLQRCHEGQRGDAVKALPSAAPQEGEADAHARRGRIRRTPRAAPAATAVATAGREPLTVAEGEQEERRSEVTEESDGEINLQATKQKNR